jgi:diguanylate cyclase (GGDEF)-like protein
MAIDQASGGPASSRGPARRRAARLLARAAHGHRLGIRARFAIAVATGLVLVAAVGLAGAHALGTTRASLRHIYEDNVLTAQRISQLGNRLDNAEEAVLYGLVTVTPGQQQETFDTLTTSDLPGIAVALADVTRLVSDSPAQTRLVHELGTDWAEFTRQFTTLRFGDRSLAARSAEAQILRTALDETTADVHRLDQDESLDAARTYSRASASYRTDASRIVVLALACLLAAALLALWLMHGLLPRVLAYSKFARRMVEGDYNGTINADGADEIAQLGQTLSEVAQRHRETEGYERTQGEFDNALQLTSDEHTAQDLLRRHLERTIPAATVTVLNRNHSADRLEAVTLLAPESPLRDALAHAVPDSCLAVRGAAVHSEAWGEQPLASCELCGGLPGRSTCTPLLVSGEVIGSVLIRHPAALDRQARRRVAESVRQAAPVVANLRNLAIAQARAATDVLTGLPNRRTLDDTIKRMVAQASRAQSPLAAVMLDLDHFKAANDELGHAKGDEILAAFGALLSASLRDSDFAARYGGEEFMVLLPSTGTAGALVIAEKLRAAVEALRIPTIDRTITTSVGIAALPDDAIDADGLARAADRALYLAKTNGRNRIEVAAHEARRTVPPGEGPPDSALDELLRGSTV